ncbi:MAG TPA: translation initiation factor IF-2, partial [Rhodanobacteraceae bacterium]|nr:translation initiation factor IF-2 [Rhodanobacteraceae bacterium]
KQITGPQAQAKIQREVVIPEVITIQELANRMAERGVDVIKYLMKDGEMRKITDVIDADTAQLIAEEFGHTVRRVSEADVEEGFIGAEDEADDLQPRAPIVTIMGHVDHGKTSLLDYIRTTKVAAGEAGGITQHIGAYHVDTPKGVITFLDTPGHAAFTSMRARGAQSTDIVVLVVAADDGVMPQTVEAIQHARAAKVPLIVAVNKMDKPEANPDNVRQGLAQHEVIPEDWGGDTQFVPVSAKTGSGVDALLEAISLQAEVMELKAVPDGRASGVVIESSLDKGRGPVATVLVQQGLLKRGDYVVCGVEYGRVRALFDESGKQVENAGPSIPVQMLGLSGVPEAGDEFVVAADEKLARNVVSEREAIRREKRLVTRTNTLEDVMAMMGKGEGQQTLNILIKADVQGSAEALRESLTAISNELVKVNVIASGVGGITESDATLAAASKALLIGFNVRADASARRVIESGGVDLRYFSIIYDVIDQVKQAASGLMGMEVREEILGVAEVRDVFRSSKFGAIAGCMVVEGTVKRHKPIRVLRDDVVVFEGELESLRHFKENVDEVRNGSECGIGVKQYNDVKPGDRIECFERIEVARTL